MNLVRHLQVILIMIISSLGFAASSILPQTDFYAPMSSMIFSDRDYFLTSNAFALMDMGGGFESFETMAFLSFNDNELPSYPVQRAWLRIASGATGTMGDTTRPMNISIHATVENVNKLLNGQISPRDFYVNNDNLLEAADSIYAYKDGICYFDITDVVNNWILYKNSNGNEGYKNNGLALSGRNDSGALDPNDNQHIGFFSVRSVQGSNPMPYSAAPAIIFTDMQSYYQKAWMPDWSSYENFTFQSWSMSSSNGNLEQPLSADVHKINSYGDPNLVWEEETMIGSQEIINPFLGWHPFPACSMDNSHPDWVDGVYGGVYRGSDYLPHNITANINVAQNTGNLRVIVQYDWYENGKIEVDIKNAVDITPPSVKEYIIDSTQQGYKWYRNTKIFELNQSDEIIKVVFTVSGEEPYIDMISIMTATQGHIPETPIRFEADLNLDGKVDMFEFASLAYKWSYGTADYTDLIDLAEMWLKESAYIWKY